EDRQKVVKNFCADSELAHFWLFFTRIPADPQKEGVSLGKFGPHDLRRTASTLLHEAGYNTDWIEKCLAHEQKGVRAVYNKAEYRDQRRAMLQDWADMIDEWTIRKSRLKD
ncbi:tyrosine-type recombinase/integrase, partial [Xanthomonas citri]